MSAIDEFLPKESLPIEQANGTERGAEIAGGFQMVTGQDAQAARVLGYEFGDAELG